MCWGWDVAQLVKCLPSIHEAPSSTSTQAQHKLGAVVHTWQGGSEAQGHSWARQQVQGHPPKALLLKNVVIINHK